MDAAPLGTLNLVEDCRLAASLSADDETRVTLARGNRLARWHEVLSKATNLVLSGDVSKVKVAENT